MLECGERLSLLEQFSIAHVYIAYEYTVLLFWRPVASITVSNSRQLGGCDGRRGTLSFFAKVSYLRNSFENAIGCGVVDCSVAGIS